MRSTATLGLVIVYESNFTHKIADMCVAKLVLLSSSFFISNLLLVLVPFYADAYTVLFLQFWSKPVRACTRDSKHKRRAKPVDEVAHEVSLLFDTFFVRLYHV